MAFLLFSLKIKLIFAASAKSQWQPFRILREGQAAAGK